MLLSKSWKKFLFSVNPSWSDQKICLVTSQHNTYPVNSGYKGNKLEIPKVANLSVHKNSLTGQGMHFMKLELLFGTKTKYLYL